MSDPPKLNMTVVPVFRVKAGAAASKASRSDAAAKTVIFPASAAVAGAAHATASVIDSRRNGRRFVRTT
jgi:hypothetical protein